MLVAIILFSAVIAINRIVIKHGDEVFSTKTSNGKIYRKQILRQFAYIILSMLGYVLIALIIFYVTGKDFNIYY
jgi:Trk-type K+ transport system membrane component